MNNILAEVINSKIIAYKTCRQTGNAEWAHRHHDALDWVATNLLPRGSGFDNGTGIDFVASKPDKIVLHTSYHHMDENGSYTHWTLHKVYIRPTFLGRISITFTGAGRGQFWEFMHEVFYTILAADFDSDAADRSMYLRDKQ